MDETPVIDFLHRLWRVPATPARLGRKSKLDVAMIVDTAVGLADQDGLEAATLPKVAKELDVTSMSLYRHVGSKQELLQLMLDAGSQTSASDETATGWRDGLRSWATDLWNLYRRRPWLARVPIYRTPAGPHQLAHVERALTQLAATPLDWDAKLTAIALLSGYARHSIVLTEELEEGRSASVTQQDSEHQLTLALHELIEADRYPQTSAMLTAGALGTSPGPSEAVADQDFLSGLELVLDGLGARIDAEADNPHA